MRAANSYKSAMRSSNILPFLARAPDDLCVRSCHSLRGRQGFTLFEVILVVAILAVLAAITYPSLETMYGGHRLTSAADRVRASWASARAHALEEGRPYRFAAVPNKGNFRIAPDSPEFWGGSNSPAPTEGNPTFVLEDVVPKPVRFVSVESLKNGHPDNSGDSQLPIGGVDPNTWAGMVVFLPDGTARPFGAESSGRDDMTVVLHANNNRPILLQIRGLTGVVTTKSLAHEAGRP